jgi:hypothetical protein
MANRLAASGRAHDDAELAGRDVERDPVERDHARAVGIVDLADVPDRQRVARHGHCPLGIRRTPLPDGTG